MPETHDDPTLRENAYLKLRIQQLQSDLTDVTAEATRLREALERRGGLQVKLPPNPLSGGQ